MEDPRGPRQEPAGIHVDSLQTGVNPRMAMENITAFDFYKYQSDLYSISYDVPRN